MADLQMWIVATFAGATPVARFMHTRWGWPAMESLHFIGLTLLVGSISIFDLRLLGIAKRIPIGALHRLIPCGLAGFAISVLTGSLFVMAEPDQYIYNPSFHLKMLFLASAGVNASLFYLTSYRGATAPTAPADAPRAAKVIAAISLLLWLSIIVAGRLITFYRPWPCGPEGPGFVAECIPDPR
jgi:hypothetical protein